MIHSLPTNKCRAKNKFKRISVLEVFLRRKRKTCLVNQRKKLKIHNCIASAFPEKKAHRKIYLETKIFKES